MKILKGIRSGSIAIFFLFLCSLLHAGPRPPQWPPLPEWVRVMHRERFDAVYWAGESNAVVTIPNFGILRASWSGYSLERVGTVTPFIISGLGETGRVQVATDQGALRFWFQPYWSSGSGPEAAVLAELTAVYGSQAVVLWSLQVSSDGSGLQLVGPTGELLLATAIEWAAGSWHQVIVNYGTNETELIVDGQVLAEGTETLSVPASVTRLVVGSTLSGELAAGGELEEVYCFARPLKLAFHYLPLAGIAALGPVSEAEQTTTTEQPGQGEGGGQMQMLAGPTSVCISNVPVFLTNVVARFITNQNWTVAFDIQGSYDGSTTGPFDIFTASSLSGNNLTNTQWKWLERGPACNRYEYTNLPPNQSYVILGTPRDSDQGGVPDAYEILITHGNTNDPGDDYFVPPDMSVGILDSALTRAHGSLPTNWNYFVLPESVKEALRSDGTTFASVGDRQIAGGLLLTNGKPRFPILICLGAEAIGDDEIAALTNYVAAGGFLFVGSSSFTRHADGSYRTNFALADQMGLSCSPSATNWVNNSQILKLTDHRLVRHLPDELIIWKMPESAEETSWGSCTDSHARSGPHQIWQVTSNGAQVLVNGNLSPYLAVKQYGSGYFIYDGALQPLIAHGGNGPGMYAYLIFRRAIEWAFESAQRPVVKLSPWPYQYDAAFMIRHDLENFVEEIGDVRTSAQYEFNLGAKGDYYFCTGAITNSGENTAAIVAGLQQAVSNYGATIGPHNGGLPNPRLSGSSPCYFIPISYEYFHWGPDEAYDTTNGYAYASNSIAISFNQIETWVTNQASSPRVWVVPYFNGTREDSYKIQEQLNVKITGDQKLTPFPHWTLSTQTDGKRYPLLSQPVSDWFVGDTVAQVIGPTTDSSQHSSQTLHDAVDFYYGLGALINFYSHSLSATTEDDKGRVVVLTGDYVAYCMDAGRFPRLWSSNARGVYDWWLKRSTAQITASYGTNGSRSMARSPSQARSIPTRPLKSWLRVLVRQWSMS